MTEIERFVSKTFYRLELNFASASYDADTGLLSITSGVYLGMAEMLENYGWISITPTVWRIKEARKL